MPDWSWGSSACPKKINKITAIPELLDHLAETNQLKGALVTIDAIGCGVKAASRREPASSKVDWIVSDSRYPGEQRFTNIRTILKVDLRTEYPDRSTFDTRLYIASAALDIERLANGVRGHWGWKHALATRCRVQRRSVPIPQRPWSQEHGYRASLRAWPGSRQQSVKTRRKSAGWNPNYLLDLLQLR
jgi:predicted transposase YbfD/YdcC